MVSFSEYLLLVLLCVLAPPAFAAFCLLLVAESPAWDTIKKWYQEESQTEVRNYVDD